MFVRNIFLFLLFLYSCSDEEFTDMFNKEIKFSAEVTSYESRISSDGSSWSLGDNIGVFMYNVVGECLSDNILYTCVNSKQKTEFTSKCPLLMKKNMGQVGFWAYYPYNPSMSNMQYILNLENQSTGSSAFDLMQSKLMLEYYSYNDLRLVHLTFEHCLSKVVLRFVDKIGNKTPVENIVIHGFNIQGIYNFSTRELSQNIQDGTSILPYISSDMSECEAILMPSSFSQLHFVSYEYEGKSYLWRFNNNKKKLQTIDKGFVYEFIIEIASSVPADVEHSGSSSKPWEDGGEYYDKVNY